MAKWKKPSHVVYQCSYHLVWVPKHRYGILQGEIKDFAERKIRAVCDMEKGRDIGNDVNARSYPHGGDNTTSIKACGRKRIGETTSGSAVIV